jgi:hypothetical protein
MKACKTRGFIRIVHTLDKTIFRYQVYADPKNTHACTLTSEKFGTLEDALVAARAVAKRHPHLERFGGI